MERIAFTIPGTDEEVGFYVLEQTRINGRNYLLVTESDDEDDEDDESEAFILKDLSESGEEEAVYEIVEEDEELEAVSGVFAELLEDIDLE